MTSHAPIVYVVDDDAPLRVALCSLVENAGLRSVACASARAFLDEYKADIAGCLVLDIRMPELNGLDLQDSFARLGIEIPTIIISGHGNIGSAVRAMKAGAVDFLEKPFRPNALLKKILRCTQIDTQRLSNDAELAEFSRHLKLLSKREREVFDIMVNGYSNKEIASALGISHRTVEIHKNHIMLKLQTDSLIDIIKTTTVYNLREKNRQ